MKIPDFCSLLERAEARVEFIIAVFCDIRGFSSFSKTVESSDAATFLKHFYLKLLRDYFREAVFAKPRGDGLLIVFRHDEHNLNEISDMVLTNCFKAMDDFPDMFKGIPIINYPTPEAIGFGVARGSASYFAAGDDVVDYSGKLLNLAARLNELAKPTGVVIDGSYQLDIIPANLRAQFESKSVYLRGIAEEEPIEVLCSSKVVLPPEALHPLREPKWSIIDEPLTVAEILRLDGAYWVRIPEPLSRKKIRAEFRWPNGLDDSFSFVRCPDAEYVADGSGSAVSIPLALARNIIQERNL